MLGHAFMRWCPGPFNVLRWAGLGRRPGGLNLLGWPGLRWRPGLFNMLGGSCLGGCRGRYPGGCVQRSRLRRLCGDGIGERRAGRAGQLDGRAIALVGVLGHAAGDHRIQLGCHPWPRNRGPGRRSREVTRDLLLHAVTGERPTGREALIQHTGQCIDVRTGVTLAGGKSLRSHIRPRADHVAGGGQLGLAGCAGDPEIDQIGEIILSDQNVGGLDIAMHQPDSMRGVQRRGNLLDNLHRPPRIQRAVG